jgi:hypothetical protein
MTQKQAGLLEPGVYRLVRKNGDTALAMVGRGFDGRTWYVLAGTLAARHHHPYDVRVPLYLAGSVRWSIVARAEPVLCVDATPCA